MNGSSLALTPTDLMASASEVLVDGGYQRISLSSKLWNTTTSRLFEDEYNIVGIAVFDTCSELLRSWPDLQGSLVEVISRHIGKDESKAWDGYLVLVTPGLAPSEGAAIDAVRYNTTRLRKLVATGDDLRRPTDIERVLRLLLPLGYEKSNPSQESPLDLLPRLLANRGIPKRTTELLVHAFQEQLPLLEYLHQQQDKP